MVLMIEEFNFVVIEANFALETDWEFNNQELTKVMQHCDGSRQIEPRRRIQVQTRYYNSRSFLM